MVSLTAAAHCQGCDWHDEGDPAAVDRKAARHVAVGHAVATVVTPA